MSTYQIDCGCRYDEDNFLLIKPCVDHEGQQSTGVTRAVMREFMREHEVAVDELWVD